jgi:hypothetical protein
VNGTEPSIQVVRPFSEAVELTKQILFRPFDLKKWFVIGFAAWLSHIGSGFNFNYQSNYSYNRRTGFHRDVEFQRLSDLLHRIPLSMLVLAIVVFVVLVVAVCILFAWLRARGRFMFTDCVVRNRTTIAEPWREFRRVGNSFFLFSLLIGFGFLLLVFVLVAPLIIVVGHHHEYRNLFLVGVIVAWGMVIFVLWIAWVLIGHLMIPIMYRRRILAWAACREAIALIGRYPDSITLYCLFWILIGFASAVVACVTVCVTCCVAAIPYIGTVVLLPMYVCLRGFGLLYLRQFGPNYDVWASIPQIAPPPLPPEPPPVPPLPA